VQSIFHNCLDRGQKKRKKEGLRKQLFVFNHGKATCLSPGSACTLYKKLVKVKLTVMYITGAVVFTMRAIECRGLA